MKSDKELLAQTEFFTLNHSVTQSQRRLFNTALKGLRPPFFSLPLLVHGAITGNGEPASGLAVACALLFLGIDIHDDLADGDLPKHWKGYRDSQVNLAATTLISSLPQIAIAKLEAPSATIAQMHYTLAQRLLRMSAGQERDLALAGKSKIKAACIEDSIANKSGEELALFACLAAQLAGADKKTIDTYSAMGRAMGTAGQLASDCYDLFQARFSQDLSNGTRTLPLALYVEKARAGDRKFFFKLLNKSKKEKTAQLQVRKTLLKSGVLRHCAFIVELYCQRALSLLHEVNPKEPYASALASFIDSLSYFPKNVQKVEVIR